MPPQKQQKTTAKTKPIVISDFSGGLSDVTEGVKIAHDLTNVRRHDNGGLKSAGGYATGATTQTTALKQFYSTGTTVLAYDSPSIGAIRNMLHAPFPTAANNAFFSDGYSVYAFDTNGYLTKVQIDTDALTANWQATFGRVCMAAMVQQGSSNAINLPQWTARFPYAKGDVVGYRSKVMTAVTMNGSGRTADSIVIANFDALSAGNVSEELSSSFTIGAWEANKLYHGGDKVKTVGGTIYAFYADANVDGWSGSSALAFTDTKIMDSIMDGLLNWTKIVPAAAMQTYDTTAAQQTFAANEIMKTGNNYWYVVSGTLTSTSSAAKITGLAKLSADPPLQLQYTEDATGGGNIVWGFLHANTVWTIAAATYNKNPIYHLIYGKDQSYSTKGANVPYGLYRYSYNTLTSGIESAIVANTSDLTGLYFVPKGLMVFANRLWCINDADGWIYFSAFGEPDFTFDTADDGGYISIKEWVNDSAIDLAQYQGRLVVMCNKNIIIYSGSDPQGEGADLAMSQILKGHGLLYPGMWVDTGRDLIFLDTNGVKSLSQAAMTGDLDINEISAPIKLIMQPYIDAIQTNLKDAAYGASTGHSAGNASMINDPKNHCIYVHFGYETTINTVAGRTSACFIYDYKFKTWSGPWMADAREYQCGLHRSEVTDIAYVTGTKRIYEIGDGDFSEVCTDPATTPPTYVAVANPIIYETAWVRFTKESNVWVLKMLEILSLSDYPHPLQLDIYVDYDGTNSIGTYNFTSSFNSGRISGDNPTFTQGNRVNPRTVIDGRGSAIKLKITQTAYAYDASITDYSLQLNRIDLAGQLSNARGQ